MASLNKDSIRDAARSAAETLKRSNGEQAKDELDGLRGEVERLVDTLQEQYGHTRDSAQQEIAGFLEELKAIDPALPEIVAETAHEMTHRRSRTAVTLVGLLLAIVAIVAIWRFTGPELRSSQPA